MVNAGSSARSRGNKDGPHTTAMTPAEDARTVLINNISWGAILAGAALALVIQLVLNLLGLGIGAATVDLATGNVPTSPRFRSAQRYGGRSRASSRPSWAAMPPAGCPAARKRRPPVGMG